MEIKEKYCRLERLDNHFNITYFTIIVIILSLIANNFCLPITTERKKFFFYYIRIVSINKILNLRNKIFAKKLVKLGMSKLFFFFV